MKDSTPLLAPYRVLDLTDEKGAFCGKFLGDLGADVIKIEPPGGDPARDLGPFHKRGRHPENSLRWFAINSGKRGITLDITSADGTAILKRLVRRADFVIESYDPGYLKKLKLDYSALCQLNPKVVVTSITPFGQDGPYSGFKASDLVSCAMGGLMYIFGDPDRAPLRFSVPQASYFGGIAGATGSLAAHWHRQATGEGQHVDVSIQESVLWATCYAIPYWDIGKVLYARTGNRTKRLKVRYTAIFPCKDGWVNYRAYGGVMFGPSQANLVKLMEQEGLDVTGIKDLNWRERGVDDTPQEAIDYFDRKVSVFFKAHTRAELLKLSIEHNFMLSVVNTSRDILDYPQLRYRDYWVDIRHEEPAELIKYPGHYYKSTAGFPRPARRAPLLGEHNEDIYEGELGLSNSDLAVLKQNGVI